MARIRSIKPEFWTSEQVVECSPTARLLFIGMWSFCDDAGIHPAGVKRLKMEVFPGDAITDDDMRALVQELIDNCLVTAYEVEGEPFWQVRGWRHQKIDRPTYRYPPPQCRVECRPNSASDHRGIDESSTPEGSRSRRESSRVESNGAEDSPAAAMLNGVASDMKAKIVKLMPHLVDVYDIEAAKWVIAREKKVPVDPALNLTRWMQGARQNTDAGKAGKGRKISNGTNEFTDL